MNDYEPEKIDINHLALAVVIAVLWLVIVRDFV